MTSERPPVLVNMLWCVPGKVGGSEEYLVRQLLGLGEQPAPCWQPTVAAAKGLSAAHPLLAGRLAMVEPAFESHRRARRITGEITWLRRHARDVALVHHGGGTAPLGAHRPFVLTVHDLQFRTYPQYFSRLKRAYLGAAIPHSIRRASVVAVPSDYVRRSVVSAYGVDDDRVRVVPHGIEPTLVADVTSEAELRARFALGDGPVLVYPAVTHPHKNHRFLVGLMATRWRDPDLRMVFIGGEGFAHAEATANADRRVRHLGRVSDADRNGLLAMAAAMVFPSEYEGFGAPVIEAMTLGVPVICADRTCLPDVAGGAALVRPLDPDAWALAFDEAVARRDELVAAGHERAAMFTSAASGAALSAAYDAALGA